MIRFGKWLLEKNGVKFLWVTPCWGNAQSMSAPEIKWAREGLEFIVKLHFSVMLVS